MKPECPFLKQDSSSATGDKKVARMSGSKSAGKGKDGGREPDQLVPKDGGKGADTTPTPRPTVGGKGEPKGDKGIIEDTGASGLLQEVTSLMKSLRSLKAVQVKFMDSERSRLDWDDGSEVALIDGGATHALRQAHVSGTIDCKHHLQTPIQETSKSYGLKNLVGIGHATMLANR